MIETGFGDILPAESDASDIAMSPFSPPQEPAGSYHRITTSPQQPIDESVVEPDLSQYDSADFIDHFDRTRCLPCYSLKLYKTSKWRTT